MKKILATLTISTLALCGAAHAQNTVSGAFFFTTTSNPEFAVFWNFEGGTPISSFDGFIVTFWSTLESDDPASLQMLGAAVTADYAYVRNEWAEPGDTTYAGLFEYIADDQVTMNATGTTLFAMRIFRVDQQVITDNFYVMNWTDDQHSSYSSLDGIDRGWLENVWNNSRGDHYLEVLYTASLDGGDIPSLENTGFRSAWLNDHGGSLELIPEPSAWLLLGMGAALVVVMRSRRKQS
jgi:putative globular PEP-CTERM protein (TIGR04254 family)